MSMTAIGHHGPRHKIFRSPDIKKYGPYDMGYGNNFF